MSELSLDKIGTIASILGFIVTIIGFIFTLYKIKKVRNAAESAYKASIEMHNNIRRYDAIEDLVRVAEIIDEIRRLQREESWKVVQDRYSLARKKMISIKTQHPDLNNSQKRIIQSIIQHLANIESDIEKFIANEKELQSIADLNIILSEQRDKIVHLSFELKKQSML